MVWLNQDYGGLGLVNQDLGWKSQARKQALTGARLHLFSDELYVIIYSCTKIVGGAMENRFSIGCGHMIV